MAIKGIDDQLDFIANAHIVYTQQHAANVQGLSVNQFITKILILSQDKSIQFNRNSNNLSVSNTRHFSSDRIHREFFSNKLHYYTMIHTFINNN